MKIQNISWDQDTVDHIANHRVSPEEVEQVLFNDYDIPVIMRGKQNKYITYGETDSGRFLFVVLLILPPSFKLSLLMKKFKLR